MRAWSEFLAAPQPHGHAVQIYRDVEELAASVAAYFAAGFAIGAPALLVATEEHRDALLDVVSDPQRLVVLDARETLARFMRRGVPSSAAFDEVVGGVIEELGERYPGKLPRVFGEMVDVLVRDGQDEAAISLEELWNSLAWSRRFSLLCGYELDVFSRNDQRQRLPEICRTHTHVKPANDTNRLAKAVDAALEDVFGERDAKKLYVVVSEHLRGDRIPTPQLLLMWISEHLPMHADRILRAARTRYEAAPDLAGAA
jgi:DcmR-like sensory protein